MRSTRKRSSRHRRNTRRHRNKSHTRRHRNKSHRRRHRNKSHRRKHRRKQYGGKTSSSWLSMDNRYRPFGGIEDTVNYNGKKIYNNMVGNYHGTDPSTSQQPIGKQLSINDLQFGVGSAHQAAQIFNVADKQASLYTQ